MSILDLCEIKYERVFQVIVKNGKIYYQNGERDKAGNPKFQIFGDKSKGWCSISRKVGNKILRLDDWKTKVERSKEEFQIFCVCKNDNQTRYFSSDGKVSVEGKNFIFFKSFTEIVVNQETGKWTKKK